MNEDITIRIREDGSRVVSKNITGIGDSAVGAEGKVDGLKTALSALGAYLSINQLQQWADTWGAAGGLIRTSTRDLTEAAAVQEQLYASAQKTRTEYSAVVELYSRAARAGADLGASQQDLIKFTEGVGKALAIQGTSASQASGALFQLGQALTGNKIQAQEYNSLIDQAPELLKTVAENLDGTGGSIGGLTKLVKDGKVSNKEFFDAFLAGSDKLDERFGQTSNLFSQGWTVLSNAAAKYVGQLNETLGLSQKFQTVAQWLAANMPTVAAALMGVAAAMAIAFLPSRIIAFYGAVQKLWFLLLANPFVAVAAAVAGVITAIYMMRDSIKLGIDDTTTLGDLIRSVWEGIGPLLQTVANSYAQFFSWLSGTSAGTFDEMLNNVVGHAHASESVWLKMIRFMIQTFDMVGGTVRGVSAGMIAVVMKAVAAIMNNFVQLGNAFNAVTNMDGAALLDAIKSNVAGYQAAGTDIGGTFMAAFAKEQLSQADNGLEALLDERLKRAQEIAKARSGDTAAVDLGVKLGSGSSPVSAEDKDAAKKLARELEQLKNSLRGLQDQVDPVGAATRELAEAEVTLNKAVTAGLLSTAEKGKLYDALADVMKEQLQPYETMIGAMQRENHWLTLSADQYRIEAELFQRTQDLKRSGITVTEAQTEALRQELQVREHLQLVAQQRDSLEGNTSAKQLETFQAQLEAWKQLVSSGGVQEGDVAGALQQMLPWANLSNTQEQMAAYVQAHADMYAQIDALEQASVISHQTAEALKTQADQQYLNERLATASTFFGSIAQLSRSQNKKMAAIGKAAAIAQTVINTYQSATAAYSAMAGIQYVGPFLGAAAAAAAVAAGIANVQAIRSQNVAGFRTGGEFMVGGHGGADSQMVQMRATPGERISINTPAQARALEQAGNARSDGTVVNMQVTQQFMSKPDRTTDRQQSRAIRRDVQRSIPG